MNKLERDALKKLIEKYRKAIGNINFALPEQNWLNSLTGDEDAIDIIDKLVYFSLELNGILENCPDSITVMDRDGFTLRANKAFEETTDIKCDEIMGKNMIEIENKGLFKPSVYSLVKKEKRKISVLQDGKNWRAIATGVPVFDEDGEIYRVISNARNLEEIQEITDYVQQGEKKLDESEEGTIIAESKAMQDILKIAGMIAGVDSSVLITGESGVGKGVIARFIHKQSPRKNGDFVEINCGAIPDTLLESELFGYESGAFTGANQKGKPGLIEIADKGTLFLDEIGELPLALQVKLLKFLQNHKITRIGGIEEKSVDVRVVAATNKDLEEMVVEGTFRDDLFYRLNVVPIHIPPLRERPEDIYPAARYFAEKYRSKYHKNFEFNDDFLETLKRYKWLGNMRELENYMERVVVMSGEETSPNLLRPARNNMSLTDDETVTLQEKLEKYEAQLIKEAYDRYGNTYKVADALGISQPNASRKIRKYVKGE